jgi:hypothetical protein
LDLLVLRVVPGADGGQVKAIGTTPFAAEVRGLQLGLLKLHV